MMFDRNRVNRWARVIAILLAAVFVFSFILFGIGTNVSYNLFDLLGGGDEDQQAGQTVGPEDQIARAEQNLEENPDDPQAIKTLGALYLQNNQLEDAVRVLERGREVAPEDPEMATLLGQVYFQQAQAAPEEERAELYRKAGDTFAAATEIDPENEDAFLLAGSAYDQAGDPGKAIKYWNGYLDLEPEGEQADAVKERITALLEGGGETTGGAEGARP